jgi:hypothetical protein
MAYTREQIEGFKTQILDGLQAGLSIAKAVKAAGVTERSCYLWRHADSTFDAACKLGSAKRPDKAPSRAPVARKAAAVPVEEQGDVIETICAAIRKGLPIDYACLKANVLRGALREWMTNDPEISARVNKAQAENFEFWLDRLRDGATTDWKASLAYLERIFPAFFAEVKAVEMHVKTDEKTTSGYIDVTPEKVVQRLSAMSDAELQEMIAKEPI